MRFGGQRLVYGASDIAKIVVTELVPQLAARHPRIRNKCEQLGGKHKLLPILPTIQGKRRQPVGDQAKAAGVAVINHGAELTVYGSKPGARPWPGRIEQETTGVRAVVCAPQAQCGVMR